MLAPGILQLLTCGILACSTCQKCEYPQQYDEKSLLMHLKICKARAEWHQSQTLVSPQLKSQEWYSTEIFFTNFLLMSVKNVWCFVFFSDTTNITNSKLFQSTVPSTANDHNYLKTCSTIAGSCDTVTVYVWVRVTLIVVHNPW